ncbi:hypothetical protein [Streptomyces fradiae]
MEAGQFGFARAKWGEITAVEPYTTYRNLFNVPVRPTGRRSA